MNDIMLTNGLIRRVQRAQAERGEPALMLRLAIDGGGCQGFEYKFEFTRDAVPEDRVFERDGVRLLIDETSLPLVAGSTVDFVDELAGASFKVLNPNALSTCGCGTSFSA